MQSRATFGSKWKIGDTICCSVDIDNRSIRFSLNGDATDRRWGVAFENVGFTGGLTPAFTAQPPAKFYVNFGQLTKAGKPLKFAPPPGYEPISTFINATQDRFNPNSTAALTDGSTDEDDFMPKVSPALAHGLSMALVRKPASAGGGGSGGLGTEAPSEVQMRVTSGYAHALVSTEQHALYPDGVFPPVIAAVPYSKAYVSVVANVTMSRAGALGPQPKSGLGTVRGGKWYFEVNMTGDTTGGGRCLVGWANTKFFGESAKGLGVGDDKFSWGIGSDMRDDSSGFGGSNKNLAGRHDGSKVELVEGLGGFNRPLKSRDVVGCFADLDAGTLSFALNGSVPTVVFKGVEGPIFPAISLGPGFIVNVNFGQQPFKHLGDGLEGKWRPVQEVVMPPKAPPASKQPSSSGADELSAASAASDGQGEPEEEDWVVVEEGTSGLVEWLRSNGLPSELAAELRDLGCDDDIMNLVGLEDDEEVRSAVSATSAYQSMPLIKQKRLWREVSKLEDRVVGSGSADASAKAAAAGSDAEEAPAHSDQAKTTFSQMVDHIRSEMSLAGTSKVVLDAAAKDLGIEGAFAAGTALKAKAAVIFAHLQ